MPAVLSAHSALNTYVCTVSVQSDLYFHGEGHWRLTAKNPSILYELQIRLHKQFNQLFFGD